MAHKQQGVMEGHHGQACLQAEALVLSDREDKVDFGKLLLEVVAVVAFMAAVAVTVPGLPAQITEPVVVTTGEGLMTTVVVAVPIQAPIFTVTE